jgi:hypothetical protein
MAKPDEPADEPIVLNSVEGRQGFLGRPVLAVLVVSILLAVFAMYVAGVLRF